MARWDYEEKAEEEEGETPINPPDHSMDTTTICSTCRLPLAACICD